MSKMQHTPNPRVSEIFQDLENYQLFCQEYGYKYDEATLYDMRSQAYRQYDKFVNGKTFRDRWVEDAKAFNE